MSFDAVKLWAIFLVIYGHCVQHLLPGFEYENYVYLFIYSFHMPLFMMVSGYFSHSSMCLSYSDFLRKKARQLLLPCITWGGIIILVRFLLCDPQSISIILRNDLWFLKSLFLCMVLTYGALKVPKKYRFLVFVVLMMITQFSLFRMKDMFVPFIAGYYLKEYWQFMKKYNALFFFCFFIIYFIICITSINPSFFDVQRTSMIGFISKQSVIWLAGISGSMIFIILMNVFSNWISLRVCKLGQYTLGIYFVQTVFLETVLSHYITISSNDNYIIYLVIFPLVCVLLIFLSVGIVDGIEKNRITKLFFLGKN